MVKLDKIEFIISKVIVIFAGMVLISSCGSTKNLSEDSFNTIRTVSVNINHINTEQKNVEAIGFWFGSKSYSDFMPLLERDKLLAKIFRQAMFFQIDSNDFWEVTDDEHSDVDFIGDYSVFLSQTADTTKYQLILMMIGRLVDKDGNTIWKKRFTSDFNPYSNEKVAYPLQDFYRTSIVLKHAVGAASVQLSGGIVEDLGGTFSWPKTPIWEEIE